MEKLQTLILSNKNIDTSMALEFIKNNVSDEWPVRGQYFYVNNENKTTKHDINDIETLMKDHNINKKGHKPDGVRIGKKFAKKIEENVDMFVQLEFLARGTDERDVRDGHIKLMSQLMRCSNALWNNMIGNIFVTENTPLYILAAVAQYFYGHCEKQHSPLTILVAAKTMKPLCQFFVQLGREVGLCIPIVYGNEDDFRNNSFIGYNCPEDTGCTGVVAEWSDLDSAIDAFIHSSITAPWRLKQIYVQECIFEEFKESLAAKARNTADTRDFAIDGKTFLIESFSSDRGIPVHAYRTTKELLSFLETPYLSLWAADSSLSNEIALNAAAYTVWINDYGSFNGPARSALSVYNLRFLNTYKLDKDDIDVILTSWLKLDTSERLDVIIGVVEASESELLPELNCESDNLLHVTNSSVCFGVQQHQGVIVKYDDENKIHLLRTIKSLVNGNAVVFMHFGRYLSLFEQLRENGVPIFEHGRDAQTKISHYPLLMERLKVVRSNYGTIFAN